MTSAGFRFLDPATPEEEVARVLRLLADDAYTPETLEGTAIDLKEDASRRDQETGTILAGTPNPKNMAEILARGAACFANTPGGGALVVGVNDKTGEITGTGIDADWLRSRIHELTNGKMGATVREVEIANERILVIITPQAVEPVPFKGKYRYRQGDKCVEVPSSVLVQGRFAGAAADPSYMQSSSQIQAVTDRAMALLCGLAAEVDPLKAALDPVDVVVRLGLRFGDTEYLNKAGEILLTAREQPAIDYTYRDVQGGPSRVRINQAGRSLLEEIVTVEAESARNNPVTEIQVGFVVHRVRHIPQRSLREAILNGVCHRDWNDHEPTTAEHIGSELRVTSPGGFLSDITSDNIMIRHEPRYRTLMNGVRGLGLVEQEGVGIDRMFTDLIRIGADLPIIEMTMRPSVRVVLTGRSPDPDRFRFFAEVKPGDGADDADLALAVWMASNPDRPYLTALSCRSTFQRSSLDEATRVLMRVTEKYTLVGDTPVFLRMRTPPGTPSAWRLSREARRELRMRPPIDPAVPARAWTRERGRISSPEYHALVGVSLPTAVKQLKEFASAEGLLPSSSSGKGRGFHYIAPDENQV